MKVTVYLKEDRRSYSAFQKHAQDARASCATPAPGNKTDSTFHHDGWVGSPARAATKVANARAAVAELLRVSPAMRPPLAITVCTILL